MQDEQVTNNISGCAAGPFPPTPTPSMPEPNAQTEQEPSFVSAAPAAPIAPVVPMAPADSAPIPDSQPIVAEPMAVEPMNPVETTPEQPMAAAPIDPVVPPSPQPMAPVENAPLAPSPETTGSGKKKTGLIVGIIVGLLVIGGGVAAFFLFILPLLAGDVLSCSSDEATMFGITTTEQYVFRFNGEDSSLGTTDYKSVLRIESDSFYGSSIDDLYDIAVESLKTQGTDKASVNKQGDSIVAEIKGLERNELREYTGLNAFSTGSVTKDDVKKTMEAKDYTCK